MFPTPIAAPSIPNAIRPAPINLRAIIDSIFFLLEILN
jgi:hypothetical protein